MKTTWGLLMFLVLIIGPGAVPLCSIQALAQQQSRGCCKERDTLSSTTWRRNGLNLQNCTRLNDKKDGDDVSQSRGFVWWDQQCS